MSRIDHGALESEARFIAQLAATIAAGEVASSPPEKIFEGEDRLSWRDHSCGSRDGR